MRVYELTSANSKSANSTGSCKAHASHSDDRCQDCNTRVAATINLATYADSGRTSALPTGDALEKCGQLGETICRQRIDNGRIV